MTLSRVLVSILACALAAFESGCAQVPEKGRAAQTVSAAESAPSAKQPPEPALPEQELTPQLLYQHMLAEMAINRGELGLAAQAYVDLARKTRDPRIARRATGVAVQARQAALAVEAATVWLQSDPNSLQARQTLASILISSGALQDVRPHLEMFLATDPKQTPQVFLQLNNLLAHHADKAAVAALIKELAQQYPKLPEAHIAVAQAYWNADQPEIAAAEAGRALELRPDWELAALFRMQALQRRGSAEAIAFGRKYLAAYPAAKDIRLSVARLLVNDHRNDEARKEIQALVKQHGQDPAVALAAGLLAVQASDWSTADAQLKRVLELDATGANVDTVRFYLGQVSEELKRTAEALQWYRAVGEGDQFIPAQSRIATLLAKQGKVSEARALLQAIPSQSLPQRIQLVQAEAGMLRDTGAYQQAYDVLSQASEKYPNTPELMYDLAMMAEKTDRLDVLETNLRRLIEMRPDHAHAYNALGYTLADRTDRFEEAYQLIDKALKLAPEDPFIQDSMGWVLYRLGRLQEARSYLEKAYKRRPDPEIAAHLGEVLWALGRRDEARRMWQSALAEHPTTDPVLAVIKKFLQ
jgi:tetratricopeptide (TPR) repeat protein